MRKRLPTVLATAALAVALLGWTPIGEAAQQAAVQWVKKALYAKNAGKVNGIKASTTPQPNKLLALDAAGMFPASVLPAVVIPPGPIDPGTPALGDAYSTYLNGPVDVSNFGDTIATLAIPEAGGYVILAKAWFANESTATTNAIRCSLTAQNDRDVSEAVLEPYGGANANEGALAFNVVHTFTAAGSAVFHCEDFAAGNIKANQIKITAIEVGSLTNAPA